MPNADRIVIEQKRLCGTLAAPSFIEKNKRVRPPRKPVPGRSVPSKPDQAAFGFSIGKSGANHFLISIAATVPHNRLFGYSVSRGNPTNVCLDSFDFAESHLRTGKTDFVNSAGSGIMQANSRVMDEEAFRCGDRRGDGGAGGGGGASARRH
jgi:hypothetical protein